MTLTSSAQRRFWGGILRLRITPCSLVTVIVLLLTVSGGALLRPAILDCSSKGLAQMQQPTEPNVPVPREDMPDWMEYHETLKARAHESGSRIRLLLLGDSITEELMGTHKGHTSGWDIGAPERVKLWEEYYEPLDALNLGMSGDQTEHLLWRLQHGELPDSLRPKSVMLAIGTNNLGSGIAPETTAEGIIDIVKYLEAVRPDAFICVAALFPRSEGYQTQEEERVRPWAAIDETNSLVKEKLDTRQEGNVRFIDCNNRFLTKNDAGDPELNTEMFLTDMLHLTVEGLREWVDCVHGDLLSGLE